MARIPTQGIVREERGFALFPLPRRKPFFQGAHKLDLLISREVDGGIASPLSIVEAGEAVEKAMQRSQPIQKVERFAHDDPSTVPAKQPSGIATDEDSEEEEDELLLKHLGYVFDHPLHSPRAFEVVQTQDLGANVATELPRRGALMDG